MSKLSLAAMDGDINTVTQLLSQQNVDVEAPSKNGHSPLILAVDKGHKDIVALLLKAGANPIKPNKGNFTPIQCARLFDKRPKDIMELLLQYLPKFLNPDTVNQPDSKGRTPLYYAVWCGNKTAVTELLNLGANPLAPLSIGTDILSWTHDKKELQEIYLILRHHAFPWLNKQPEEAETILSGYCWKMPEDGTAITITYTFDKGSVKQGEPFFNTYQALNTTLCEGIPLNEKQREAVSEALNYYQNLLQIRFVCATEPDKAQLVIRQVNLALYQEKIPARTDLITDEDGCIQKANLLLDMKLSDNPYKRTYYNGSTRHNERLKTITHELGHAFGLKHPEDEEKYPITSTIMSYNHTGLNGIYPTKLMENDLKALKVTYPEYAIKGNYNGIVTFMCVLKKQNNSFLLKNGIPERIIGQIPEKPVHNRDAVRGIVSRTAEAKGFKIERYTKFVEQQRIKKENEKTQNTK